MEQGRVEFDDPNFRPHKPGRSQRRPPVSQPPLVVDAPSEARKLRGHLRDLVTVVEAAIANLDVAMKGPSTYERGQRVAQVCSSLELAKDIAKRYGLGEK